jgi:hypothetical protein
MRFFYGNFANFAIMLANTFAIQFKLMTKNLFFAATIAAAKSRERSADQQSLCCKNNQRHPESRLSGN